MKKENTNKIKKDQITPDSIVSTSRSDVERPIPVFTVFKLVTKLGWEIGLSYSFSLTVLALNILLGKLSKNEVDTAATALVVTTLNSSVAIGVSPLFAMNNIASRKEGQTRDPNCPIAPDELKKQIAAVNRAGIVISCVPIPVVFSILFFSKTILTAIFHQGEEAAELAQKPLRVYSFAIFPLILRICFEQMIFSFRKSRPAMVISLTSFSFATLLAYLFGFGTNNTSGMGSIGIALGYLVEAYATFFAFGIYLANHRTFREYRFFLDLFKEIKKIPNQVGEVLKQGCPILFSMVNEMFMAFAVSIAAGLIGTAEQAATTYALQIIFFNIILQLSFGHTCYQEVGRAAGEASYVNASRIGKIGLLTTFLWAVPIPLTFSIFPTLLTSAFGQDNDEVESYLKYLMPLMGVGTIIDALRYNMLQQLRALENKVWSTTISACGIWGGIALVFILGPVSGLGVYGVGAGYTIGITSAFVGLLISWIRQIQPDAIEQSMKKESPSLCGCFSGLFAKVKSKRQGYLPISQSRHEEPAVSVNADHYESFQPLLS